MAKATPEDLSAWNTPINLDATRKLVEQLQADGQPWDKLDSSDKKYIPNYRRICPKRADWENPYQVFPVHRLGANNRNVVCLKEAGLGNCPACTLRWQLHDANDKAGAQALRHQIRTYINVVKVDKSGNLTEEKVFLLSLNQLQFFGKRGVEYDPDEEGDLPLYGFFEKYGDLSNVETGRDLLIKVKSETFSPPGGGTATMLHLKFTPADPSPFPGTSKMLNEGLVELPSVVPVVSADEMSTIIEGRSENALAVVPQGQEVSEPQAAPALPAPPTEAAPSSRFGGEDDDGDEPAEEPPPPNNPRASQPAPVVNDTEALNRLRQTD